MLPVRGGEFKMGDRHGMYIPSSILFPKINCVPVKIDDFHISSKLITNADWYAVMRNEIRSDKLANIPVTNVSWNDVQMFIEKLNGLLQCEFHLPTEAQWEYAARGGDLDVDHIFAGGNILNQYGWYDENSGFRLHDVATKRPNLLGLFDMCGNVWEWCQDWSRDWYRSPYPKTGAFGLFNGEPTINPQGPLTGVKKIIRGGSYKSSAKECWVFYRAKRNPTSRKKNIGFRLAY